MESHALLRTTETLAQLQQHWRKRAREARANQTSADQAAGLSIAVTREAGVPGTAIARQIGSRLGWPVYDHELVEKIAEEAGWRVDLVESIDERRRNWLEESVEQFMDVPSISEMAYLRHLVQTILALGAHGECVLVERGAAQLLAPETTLRVRFFARHEDRIREIGRRFNLTGSRAVHKLHEIERERARFIRDFFQKDVTEPTSYDLLVNTSHWSTAECADLVIDALEHLQERLAARRAETAGSLSGVER